MELKEGTLSPRVTQCASSIAETRQQVSGARGTLAFQARGTTAGSVLCSLLRRLMGALPCRCPARGAFCKVCKTSSRLAAPLEVVLFRISSLQGAAGLSWSPFPSGRERAFSPSYCVPGSSDPRNSTVTARMNTCLTRECSKRAYPLLSFVPKPQEAGSMTRMKRLRLGKARREPGSAHSTRSLRSPASRCSPWPRGSGPGWRLGPFDRKEWAKARAPGQRGRVETQGQESSDGKTSFLSW